MNNIENLIVDCDSIVHSSVEQIGKVCDITKATIYTLEGEGDALLAFRYVEWSRRKGISLSPRDPGWAFIQKYPEMYAKLTKNIPVTGSTDVLFKTERKTREKNKIHSFIMLPIHINTHTLWGFVLCEHTEDYAWTAGDLSLLLEISHKIGAAIARKQQIQMLQQNNEQYRFVIDNVSDIVEFIDAKGIIRSVRGYLTRISGYTLEDVVGHSAYEFVYEEDLERLKDGIALIRKGRRTDEYRMKRKSGEVRWTRVNSHPVYEDGEYKGIWCVVMDVDDIKRSEERARAGEELYRLLADNIQDLVWAMDLNFRFTYISPSNGRHVGITREELMSKPLEELLNPDRMKQVKEIVAEELAKEASGEPSDPNRHRIFIIEQTRRNGRKRYIEFKASFMRNKAGKPVGIVGIARDITERKLIEDSLRATEARQRSLLENIQDVLLCYNRQGIITYLSDNIKVMTGYEPGELIGKPCADLIHVDFRPHLKQNLTRLENAEGVISEYLLKYKDGSYHWYSFNCNPNLNENGDLKDIICVMVNIDKYKEVEQEFREIEKTENLYEHIVNQVPDLVWAADMDYLTIYMSPSVKTTLGYTVEEAMSIEFGTTYKPESFNKLINTLREAHAASSAGKGDWSTELTVYQFKRNRRTLKGRLRLSILCDNNKKPYGYLGITSFRRRAPNHRRKESPGSPL